MFEPIVSSVSQRIICQEGLRAEHPDRSRDVRQIVRHHRLAEQRLSDARLELIRDRHHLGARAERALADQNRHSFACVQDLGGPLESSRQGIRLAPSRAEARVHEPCLCGGSTAGLAPPPGCRSARSRR